MFMFTFFQLSACHISRTFAWCFILNFLTEMFWDSAHETSRINLFWKRFCENGYKTEDGT